jgi:hypothetical protein
VPDRFGLFRGIAHMVEIKTPANPKRVLRALAIRTTEM